MKARHAITLAISTFMAAAFAPAHAAVLTAGQADAIVNNNSTQSTDSPNILIVWEGNKLVGAGEVSNWTFNTRYTGRTVTPLLVSRSGGAYTVEGVGATVVTTGTGRQTHNFGLASGTAAYDARGDKEYFLGWQNGNTGGGSPITHNNNAIVGYGQQTWYTSGALPSAGSSLSLGNAGIRAYWAQAEMIQPSTTVQSTGGVVGPHGVVDGNADLLFVDSTQLTTSGNVSSWGLYSRTSGSVTPYLFEHQGGLNYDIVGIGTTREITTGTFTFDFGLVSGVDVFNASSGDYYLGWRTAGNDGSGAAATVPYDAGAANGVYYLSPGGATYAALDSLAFTAGLPRTYAISFTTQIVPEPSTLALLGVGLLAIRRFRRQG